MMLFYSETNKILFVSPPPPIKAQEHEWSQYGYMHMCLFIPAACDMDFYKVDIE